MIPILILAGLLAGLVNFFVNYINLPFSKPDATFASDQVAWKDIWWIALIGYAVVGCAGAFLTPLINSIMGTGLKGLEWVVDKASGKSVPKEPLFNYILFGYGLLFGYSASKLLISMLNAVVKKVSLIDKKLSKMESVLNIK